MTTYLEPDQVPATLKRGYSGRKFQAIPCESTTLQHTYWDGGSCHSYSMVNLSTGQSFAPNGDSSPPEFGGTLTGQEITIPAGFVLVEHSIFCGKDMGLRFYMRLTDIAPLLPKQETLPDDQLIVLGATAQWKNTYGGRKEIRFHEASYYTKITRERWDAAKSALIESGHLRSNASITTKGRNALGDFRVDRIRD